MKQSLIETEKKGVVPAVRVDDIFLCKCGCGKRVHGNNLFFSRKCYSNYLKNQRIKSRTPTCQWCRKPIPEGDRHCSQECKQTDYKRRGWKLENGGE